MPDDERPPFQLVKPNFGADFRGFASGGEPPAPAPPAIWSSADAWVEERIPRRAWVVIGYLLRGAVTLLPGPGSAGKSMLMVAWAAAGALGLVFHRFCPAGALRVLLYNTEDDAEEQQRRFSATLRQFGATSASLQGMVMRAGPCRAGTLIHFDPMANTYTPTDAMRDLEEAIKAFKPDAVFLDPLVELHDAQENDNTALRQIVAIFRELAQRHNIAVAIADHTRKGSGDGAGDPDIARGASAKIGAARIVLTVVPMSKDDAAKLSISEEQRRAFFRVDGAKQNYAALHQAEWFERIEYELDNGEMVAAAVPWHPPSDVITAAVQADLEYQAARGTGGVPYSPRLGAKEPRSLVHLCERLGLTTLAGYKNALSVLRSAGFTEERFRTANRKKALGLRGPEGGPDADWITDESKE